MKKQLIFLLIFIPTICFSQITHHWNVLATNKTSSTTNTFTLNSGAGDHTQLNTCQFIVIVAASDNTSTGDGDGGEVTSITDPRGNTFTKIIEFTNGQGSAAAGATISVWWAKVTSATYAGSDNIVINYGSNRTAKYAILTGYRAGGGGGTDVRVTTGSTSTLANDGANYGSMSTSLSSLARLTLRATASEGDVTATTVTTNFTRTVATDIGTTGSGAASNMMVYCERRIRTATGETSQPSDATASKDRASVMFAIEEYTPSAVSRRLSILKTNN